MKRALWIPFAILICTCSNLVVKTDADPDLDRSAYHTYTWPGPGESDSHIKPLISAEFSNEHIRKAIDEQMNILGYKLTDSLPDLRVHYHFIVEDKKLLVYDNDLYETYSSSWYPPGHFAYRYEEGSFIIDIMEVKTGHIVWRGWAERIIENYPFTLPEKEVNRIVKKIFEKYPPRQLSRALTTASHQMK